jgi:hypothetical protein
MDDKIVLICAVGRSGSTTLQLILNTIPNSNICGENNAALINLLEFYRNIKITNNYIQIEFKEVVDKKNISEIFEKRIKPAWFNTFNLDEIKENIKNMIIALFKKNNDTNLWGFKEIRYVGKVDLINEFKELFPQTKVIINIREDIQKQSKSAWFKEIPNSVKIIKTHNSELINYYYQNKSFCFLNTLERMYNKEHMENLFKFIDCYNYFNESKIQLLLNKTRES